MIATGTSGTSEATPRRVSSEISTKLSQGETHPGEAPCFDPGFRHMCYHPKGGAAWLEANGFDPSLAGCVHVYDVSDYVSDRHLWGPGGAILHELAHAHHDASIADGHDNATIVERYERAVVADKRYDQGH